MQESKTLSKVIRNTGKQYMVIERRKSISFYNSSQSIILTAKREKARHYFPKFQRFGKCELYQTMEQSKGEFKVHNSNVNFSRRVNTSSHDKTGFCLRGVQTYFEPARVRIWVISTVIAPNKHISCKSCSSRTRPSVTATMIAL